MKTLLPTNAATAKFQFHKMLFFISAPCAIGVKFVPNVKCITFIKFIGLYLKLSLKIGSHPCLLHSKLHALKKLNEKIVFFQKKDVF